MLEVESESFLKRIRNLQLFMDDVGEQNLLSCNELLDTNGTHENNRNHCMDSHF
jgi:hypothetical protein